jgi:SAM-dependent methyltransferase
MSETAAIVMRACPCCEASTVAFQRVMAGATILECTVCGSAFAAAVPDPDKLQGVYDRLYSEGGAYQAHRNEVPLIARAKAAGQLPKLDWPRRVFLRRVKPNPGDTLLEVGCGTGLFLFAAHLKGWTATGVELCREAAELGAAVHQLPVFTGPVEAYPAPREKFTAIVAWEVMEHLPEPGRFLAQVLGMLKPGGIFAGSVPNYARPRYRFGDDLGPASVPPVHLNFWTPPALRNTLARAGFWSIETVVPRFCTDLLRPLHALDWERIKRFAKVILGLDTPTEMFFMARKTAGGPE